MTADQTPRPLLDPREVAADARSILACPASVTLRVPGRPGVDVEDGLGMQECRGTPGFVCAPDSPLAAAVGHEATLTVRSGLGPAGSFERSASVSIVGRLEVRGSEACACCGDDRLMIALVPADVTLCGDETAADPLRVRVPIDEYAAARHELNRGLLQRSAEHANDHHQDELRHSVSVATRTPISQVLGVSVAELGPAGVTIDWLDPQGAHRSTLAFPRAARTAAELGGLLRRELDTGVC